MERQAPGYAPDTRVLRMVHPAPIGMSLEPCHLQYDLTRRQRWDVHVGAWLPALPRYLFVVAVMALLIWGASLRSWWFLLFALAPLWVMRGFIAGILNIAFVPVQHMDIIINEHGLGWMTGGGRCWAFLDSIVQIHRFRDDLWSFLCYHGEMISVPASLISAEMLAHVRAKTEWARTPEGVQAAVHRGRLMVRSWATGGKEAAAHPLDKQGKPDG